MNKTHGTPLNSVGLFVRIDILVESGFRFWILDENNAEKCKKVRACLTYLDLACADVCGLKHRNQPIKIAPKPALTL